VVASGVEDCSGAGYAIGFSPQRYREELFFFRDTRLGIISFVGCAIGRAQGKERDFGTTIQADG
jgi:hypothetical protein